MAEYGNEFVKESKTEKITINSKVISLTKTEPYVSPPISLKLALRHS